MSLLKIICKKAGFRRGGVAWTEGESIVPIDAFTKEQLQQIEDEPMLIVSEPDDAEIAAWDEANESASTKTDARPEDEAEAKNAIAAAITAIGGDKKPKVKDVNAKLDGWETNGKEIDAIWKGMND